MLSVYRQGRPPSEMDHLVALGAAAGESDVELVAWCFTHDRSVFAGLNGEACVIKVKADGDETLRFEGLMDDALTAHDLKRMQEHKVDAPEEIGMSQYRVRLAVELPQLPMADFLIKATSDADCAKRVRMLVKDEDFRRAMTRALFENMFNNDFVSIRSAGGTLVADPAPAHALPWEFLTDPDAD